MTNIIIHIGLPKTGTTTIQNHLFSKLPKDRFNYIHEVKDDLRIKESNFRTHELDKVIGRKSKRNYRKFIKKDKINIFSDEALTVPSQYKKDRIHKMSGNALSLKDYFGEESDYKIILTLRNHVDWMYSLYIQLYGNEFLNKKIDRHYFDDGNLKHSIASELNYYELIKEYTNVFGRESINILFYEDFLNDRQLFIKQFASILGVDTNFIHESLSDKHSRKKMKSRDGYLTDNFQPRRYVRLINKIRNQFTLIDRVIKGVKRNNIYQSLRQKLLFRQVKKVIPFFNGEQKNMILNTFGDSNLALADDYNLNQDKMREYGYIR